ncbi:hypothetical protein CALCODRAFT_454659 [Calocera cornea HHB12733]|uniref:Uncharacterized protein n=1 Tax=Calocera cornea HHB12733 TaxID=1353952 RepID=A0A165F4M0_9BASI|nr:hypothetical protein CALCODRAFT_454659 [Calocera cornea HHB12733]
MSMQEVEVTNFTPHILRSKTPEVSEKMALYFESMRGTTPDPPQSVHSGEDIARSERSVPVYPSRGYDNGYYTSGADPGYTMLPPEMRREDSAMRLEREVFGDDHHASSDYLRSATGRNGGNGAAGGGRRSVAGSRVQGEDGHIGPRPGRDGSYFGGDDGHGPQRVREEVRNGWDDQVRRQFARPGRSTCRVQGVAHSSP